MGLLIFNIITWIPYNVFLALIPVAIAFLMLKLKNKILLILTAIIWLLFLPNSIYLILDITHLFENLKIATPIEKILLPIQYAIIVFTGIATYHLSLIPIQKFFPKNTASKQLIIFGINILTGFALVLGRYFKINSWDIITNPQVIISSFQKIFSSGQLFIISITLGLLCFIIYHLFNYIFTELHL